MADAASVGRRRITGDAVLQLAGRLLNLALGVLVTLVLTRSLGEESFGQWATLMAIASIAGTLSELGLEQVAVARAAEDPEREGDWMGALLAVRSALTLPVLIGTVCVVLLVATGDEMRTAGLVLAVGAPLSAPLVMRAVFQLRVRNYVPVVVQIVNSVVWAAAVVVIAALDGGLVPLAIAMSAGFAITSALQFWLGVRVLGGLRRLHLGAWRYLVRAGAVLGLASLVAATYARVDQVLVFQLAGAADAGLYGAVYRILDQAQALPSVALITLLPVISAAWRVDRSRAATLFRQSMEYLAIASLPFLAFAIPAAEPTVLALFGADFAEAAPALPVLMGAFVLIAVSYPVDGMVIVLELQRRFAVHAIIGLVVNVAGNLLLVPRYGFMAAAWMTLASEVVVLGLNLELVFRHMRLRPSLGRLPRTLLAAALMGGVVLGLRAAGAPFAALVAAAVAVYPAALFALRAVRPHELASLVRREGEWSAPSGI